MLLESAAAGIPIALAVGGCGDVIIGSGDDLGDAASICSAKETSGSPTADSSYRRTGS